MKTLKVLWILTIISSFFGPSLSVPGYENFFAFRILLLGQMAGTILYFFFNRRQIFEQFRQLHVKDYLWFYFFWLCWAGLTFLWADSRADWVRHMSFLFTGFSLIGFSTLYFKKEQDLHQLFHIFALVLCLFLGVSLWEHQFRYNVGVGGSAIFFERGIPNGFMGNPNDLATFLALYVPFFYCLIKYSNNTIWQFIGLAGIPLTFHVILITRSRANLFSLLIMAAAALYFLEPWKMLRKVKLSWIGAAAVILILSFCVVNFSQEGWYFWEKEKQMLANQFGSLNESSSVSIRLTLLKQGFELLKSHYFLGVGAGNVEYHMEQFKNMTQGIVNMHNWWGEVLVNYGVLIWLLYLFFFVKMFRELLVVYRNNKASAPLRMVSEALLISFSGYVIAVTSSSTMAASSYMWVLFAVALSLINIASKSRRFF